MKHEEMIINDSEYKRTYDLMLEHSISLEHIIEVVVKSNGLVGVGVVTLKDNIDRQLDSLMKGY